MGHLFPLLFIVRRGFAYQVSTFGFQHKSITRPGTLEELVGKHKFTLVCCIIWFVHGFTVVLQIKLPPS